jgi:MFS family permease
MLSPAPDTRHPTPGRSGLTIGLLGTVSAAAFEALAVATIMPAVVSEIGGLSYYGWAFSAFMLAQIVGICAAGGVADTRGLAAPFAAGSLAFTAGLLGAGLAPSMPALIVARVVQGCGAGAISALAYAAVGRGYPPDAKPRMLALLSSAWVAPGLIGPALAGAIAEHVGWRWVFLALAPLMIGAAALAVPALRRIPAPAQDKAPPAAQLGAALALAMAGALALWAFQWMSRVAAVAGIVAATAAALPSLRSLLPAGTLTARAGQPAAIAAVGILSAAFFGAEVFVPLALTDLRGDSTTMAGLVLTSATVFWTVGAWLQERIVLRSNRRVLTGVGLAAMTAGIAATAAVLCTSLPTWIAIPTWGLSGIGIGVAYSTVSLVVLEHAVPGEEGAASAAFQLSYVLGTAIGTGATGGVVARWVERGESLAVAIAVVFAVALALALLALATAPRLPSRAPA